MTVAKWNSADKNAAIVLSSTDHTATQSGASSAWRGVRGTVGYTTGKYYFEITVVTSPSGNGWLMGVMNSAGNLASFVGSDTKSFGYQVEGTCWYNGGAVTGAHMRAPSQNAVIGVAVDLTNKLIWASDISLEPTVWNLGTSGTQNPNTAAGGIALNATIVDGTAVYPAFSGNNAGGTHNDAATINCGDSAFVGTLPTGFLAWNPVVAAALPNAAVCVISG